MSIFSLLKLLELTFKARKTRILESIFFAKQRLIMRTSFVYKTWRLLRISLLINALNKRVLLFSSGKLFYKSNRKLFSCVCIAWYKHERGWENSRQLCKPETKSRVCIAVENPPNPSRVHIKKRFLLLKCGLLARKLIFRLKYLPHNEEPFHSQTP